MCHLIYDTVCAEYNVGRGRKSLSQPRYILFMVLSVLKLIRNGTFWHVFLDLHYIFIEEDTDAKCRQMQARHYRSKRRRRMNAHFVPRPSSSSSSSTPTRHARTVYRSGTPYPESQYPESQINLGMDE